MNINSVDLNLFLIFRAIYQTRSVTLAGEQVHLTQSAVSNALKRLRDRFDDPLFVRGPNGMVPTVMATELIGLVEEGLLRFTQAIEQAQAFDPVHSDRLFRIAINDIGQLVLVPRLIEAIRAEAPNVRLQTVDAASAAVVRQLLTDGKIDVAIGSWVVDAPGLQTQRLFEETYVALLARDHPLRGHRLSLAEYLAAEHVTYRPSGTSDEALQLKLSEQGAMTERRVVLTVAHSLGLSSIVARSQLVLTVQARLAQAMIHAREDLRMAELPFAVDPVEIRQTWHARTASDRGSAWLRGMILREFEGLPFALPHDPGRLA